MFLSESGIQNSSAKMVEQGDILYAMYGATSGEVGISMINGAINQAVLCMKPIEGVNSYLIVQWLQKQKDEITKTYLQGGQGNLSGSIVKEFSMILPTEENEQTKIGQFFKTLDDTIALHQRKLDSLKVCKKSMLSKMFPKTGTVIPEIRFDNFIDEWGQSKLNEVLTKNSMKNKNLLINNVESVSNKTGFTKQTVQFEDYSVASADLSNYYVIKECQFAYNPSRINVGSIAYKKIGEEESVVSPLYVSFETTNSLDDAFAWNWFKSSSFNRQRITLSEGGVRDTLSYNQLSEMFMLLPTLEEQSKIGQFFKTLDDTIAIHQKLVDYTVNIKASMLCKMFV